LDGRTGILYVVATPIGHLDDLTFRARETLSAVDWIAAEDTRHSGRLLSHYGVSRPLVSLHEHNEKQKVPALVERLSGGERGALVSDAGTPLVSDPGYRLVRAAREAGLAVSPLPGPCAAIAALSVAGLPTDRFAFEGFLPPKAAARRTRLGALASEPRTLVFYEAVHRVAAVLADLADLFGGEREAVVARELTKAFEEVRAGALAELAAAAADGGLTLKGEFVLVVAGAPGAGSSEAAAERVLEVLARYPALSSRDRVAIASELTGARRNRLYRLESER
jgi:16S rRNA (cytidine1402-2'-O)-methyltransferase